MSTGPTGPNWTGADLTDAVIKADLDGNFTDAKLDGATIDGKLSGKFLRTSLVGAKVAGGLSGQVDQANLTGAKLKRIDRRSSNEWIRDSKLDGARLVFEFCYHAHIERSTLRDAAIISTGIFRFCNFKDSDLTGAKINIASPTNVHFVNGSLRNAGITTGDPTEIHIQGAVTEGLHFN